MRGKKYFRIHTCVISDLTPTGFMVWSNLTAVIFIHFSNETESKGGGEWISSKEIAIAENKEAGTEVITDPPIN